MASRSSNTQAEALQNVMHEIQDIMTMPDADLPFLVDIQSQIMKYVRAPIDQMMAQNGAIQPGPGSGTPNGPGGMPGGPGTVQPGPSAPPQFGGAPGSGGMPAPMGNMRPDIQGPPTDEIRRMIHGGM